LALQEIWGFDWLVSGGHWCFQGLGPVKLHLKVTHYLHLILTRLVRSSITHFVGFLPALSFF
jgi:hypothetical protein